MGFELLHLQSFHMLHSPELRTTMLGFILWRGNLLDLDS